MVTRWVRRRAHSRRLGSGRITRVRENWAFQADVEERKNNAYYHPCPDCGARIISVHMPNGGWAHFEGGKGLARIKHPCMHRGVGGRSRYDDLTPDLFGIAE